MNCDFIIVVSYGLGIPGVKKLYKLQGIICKI